MMLMGLLPLLIVFFVVDAIGDVFRRRTDRVEAGTSRVGLPRQDTALARLRRFRFSALRNRPRTVLSDTVNQADLFRLAKEMHGTLTVSDVVIATGATLQESEKYMESMVDGTHIVMDVESNGGIVYRFPEIVDRTQTTI